MVNVTGEATNPYIGPRPFRTGDTLYGRDWETQELRDLLIARRFVLLHSPSGAGKTSLIQAGLIPALEAEEFRVLPPIRVGMDPPPQVLQSGCEFNRFVLSVHISLSSLLAESGSPTGNIASLCSSTLDALFDRLLDEASTADSDNEAGKVGQRSVLIFDQFEEILTVDPLNLAAKEEFFRQLGEALKDRDRWALFAVREDYVAGLEPYLHNIPTRLSTHFRLEPLRKDAALEAIKQPVAAQGVRYAEGVAETLVDDLLTLPLGKSEFVEPVQLQVVCYDLWRYWHTHASPESTTITQAHLDAFGNVDQALANFYDTCIQTTTQQTGIRERDLRTWFDHQMITPAKTRGIVYKGTRETAGIPNEAVNVLDRLHIIRVEPRAGADWVELAHDGFIDPILESNHAWERREWERSRARFRHILQIGAVVLGVLIAGLGVLSYLRGQAANQARRDTVEIQLTGTALVEAQIAAQDQATVYARASATAFRQTQQVAAATATQRAREAQSERLLADAQIALQNNDAALALTLALDAYRLNPNNPDAPRILAEAAYAPGPRSVLKTSTLSTLYNHLAISPDERFLVVAPGTTPSGAAQQQTALTQAESFLTVWELETRTVARQLTGPSGPIVALDYAPGPIGDRILAASPSALRLWDAATGEPLWTFNIANTQQLSGKLITSAALAPDSSAVLAGGCSRWDVNGVCTRGFALLFGLVDEVGLAKTFDIPGAGSVTGVAFEPDGQTAFVVTAQGKIERCDLGPANLDLRCEMVAEIGGTGISALTVNPTRYQAILGTQDGSILIWDINARAVVQQMPGAHSGVVRGVDFGRADEPTALSVGDDGQMIWWNLSTGLATRRFAYKQIAMWDVVYRQNGDAALTAMGDNSVIWWDLTPGEQRRAIRTLIPVTALAFPADRPTLLAAYNDGQVRYWETSGVSPAALNAGVTPVTLLVTSPNPADPVVITQTAAPNSLTLWRDDVPTPVTTGLQDVTRAAFSPDGTTLAVAGCQDMQYLTRTCRAGQLLLMDAATLTVLQTLDSTPETADHLRTVNHIAFNSDGRTVLTASTMGTLLTWDLVQGQAAMIAPQPLAVTINDLAIIPRATGDQALIGGCQTRDQSSQVCTQGILIVWDMITNRAVRQFPMRGIEVTQVAASPDGQWLLAGGSDGSITRWDITTGTPVFRYTGHTGPVTGLEFPLATNDSQWFASGSADGSVILWRLDSLDALLTWIQRNRYVPSLSCVEQQQYYQMPVDPACQIITGSIALLSDLMTRTVAPPPVQAPPTLTPSPATPTLPMPTRTATPQPEAQPILIGETRIVPPSAGPQYWQFEGVAGDLLSITLASQSGTTEGSLILYTPDGKELSNASNTRVGDPVQISALTLPQTGTYTLVSQQFTVGETPYTLSITNLRITTATPRPYVTPLPGSPNQRLN